MRATILSVAAGAALLLLFTGCCNSSQKQSLAARNQAHAQLVRAQSPTAAPATAPAGATATASGEVCYEEDCFDEHGRCRHCCGLGCCHCRPYRIPTNLRYPPQDGLPGIVQYPYYTCKGPDCFFAEPNPVRPK